MTFVIGDVHGEITKLKKLVAAITRVVNKPTLIFVGDYIDKGEDSSGTLDFLQILAIEHKVVFLLGNHEYCWLHLEHEEYKPYLLKYGGKNTIDSFGAIDLLDARRRMLDGHASFFEQLKAYTIVKNYFVCHSGIPAHLFETPPERLNIKDFLFNRYDFIKHQALYMGKYTVVFGHTGFYRAFMDGFKIGVDTAACFLEDQPLTALCLEGNYLLNSDGDSYDVSKITNVSCPNIVRVKPWRSV